MSWIRKKKRFSRPRKPYDKARFEAEDELVNKYGLKNKREIWKAEAAISRLRTRAKELITASEEEQMKLFVKLREMGFKVERIADILELNKEDWLKRRLQSVLILKNFAKPKEARQLIAHKKVLINGKAINVPSYIVKTDEENNIKVLKQTKEMLEYKNKEKEE